MTEFDEVEAALGRYRPVSPHADVTAWVAAGLAKPAIWKNPWIRVAAAVVVLAVPAAWFAVRQVSQPPVSQAKLDSSTIPADFAAGWNNQPRVAIPELGVKGDVVV